MSYFLVVFLIFLLQFVYFPWGVSYFEVPKVYVAEVGIFLFLLLAIFRGRFDWQRYQRVSLVSVGVIFLVSCYHLGVFHTAYGFWGNPFRMQGTLLLWFLLVWFFLSSRERVNRISSVFLFLVLLGQFFLAVGVNSGSLGRAVGSLGEPNALAGSVVFVWPFLLFHVESGIRNHELGFKGWSLFLCLLVWFLVGGMIVISGSRSGLVAFGVQMVFVVLYFVVQLRLFWCLVVGLVLLFFSYVLPFVYRGGVYEDRGEIWVSALSAGMEHPVLGVGFGNVEYALHRENVRLGNHLVGYYVDSSHNVFLDWWVSGGIVGLGALVVIIWESIVFFVRREEVRNLLVLLGLLGVLSFNPASVVGLVVFWWVLGQGTKF